jgi:hypothetical protein
MIFFLINTLAIIKYFIKRFELIDIDVSLLLMSQIKQKNISFSLNFHFMRSFSFEILNSLNPPNIDEKNIMNCYFLYEFSLIIKESQVLGF